MSKVRNGQKISTQCGMTNSLLSINMPSVYVVGMTAACEIVLTDSYILSSPGTRTGTGN